MPWLEHRYGHMVQEYYVTRVRELTAIRRAERESVRTRADAIRMQKDVRRRIRRAFGPFPAKTPLCARVTGRIDARHFSIEKILIESRPGFLVSANLYVPKGLHGPAPCVLGACGHSENGKAYSLYQAFVEGLARKGFVALIYDPISQGERVQYPNREGRCLLSLCAEHNMMGRQMALLGDWFGAWRAWDGIRCLDYLLSRPETDPTRVGMTGNSGGGTMTTWLCGLETRLTMAAPGCFVTTWLSNVENELPADAEQIPPGALAMGLDLCDFFIPLAPRPLILLTQRADYFDQRGSQEAFRQLRRVYRLLGAEDNVRIQVGPQGHGYSIENREAMYGFFVKHTGLPGSPREPKLTARADDELAAAPDGSVRKDGSKRVFDFIRARAGELQAYRKPLAAAELRRRLSRVLALPPRRGIPHHRVLRHCGDGKTVWQPYAVETEAGIQAVVTMACPDGCQYAVPRERRCALLVPHLAAWDDLHDRKVRKILAGRGRVLGVDPRGIGQSAPQGCDCAEFFASYDCDYFFDAHGSMLAEPYLGRRVFDVLRTLDWLYACGYRDIEIVGRGLGAVPALFAGVLEPRLKAVTLMNGLLSYHELTQVPIYRWPASAQADGLLLALDLPDCYRSLKSKLTLISPWSAQMKPIPPALARRRIREMGLPAGVCRR